MGLRGLVHWWGSCHNVYTYQIITMHPNGVTTLVASMKLQGKKKTLLLLLPLSGSEAGSGDHLLLPVSPACPQEPPGGLQGICCRGCRLRRSGQQRRVSEPCSPRPLLSWVLALGHRCQKDTSPASTFCRGPFPSPSVRLSPLLPPFNQLVRVWE